MAGLKEKLKTPIELLVRSTIKNVVFFTNQKKLKINSKSHYGHQRILAPYLGEMGFEVRNAIARAEPYLRALARKWQQLRSAPVTAPRICDLPPGERILINDRKPSGLVTALSASPARNQGIDFPIIRDPAL